MRLDGQAGFIIVCRERRFGFMWFLDRLVVVKVVVLHCPCWWREDGVETRAVRTMSGIQLSQVVMVAARVGEQDFD